MHVYIPFFVCLHVLITIMIMHYKINIYKRKEKEKKTEIRNFIESIN